MDEELKWLLYQVCIEYAMSITVMQHIGCISSIVNDHVVLQNAEKECQRRESEGQSAQNQNPSRRKDVTRNMSRF
jgi:hypothetical protein